jgi:DtxR family Mn-dependent transcriptional regulator
MRTQRPSSTVEDYLQVIYTMQREGEDVIAARLKERKGVSAPTAWATLKRMERDGLISLAAGHKIELSSHGREEAESIIRRHMLAERLLSDILKLDWAEVHEEAHRVEHAISPRIERQILLLLDQPTTCPHGNPIPGAASLAAAQRTNAGFPLIDVEEGTNLRINSIVEHAEDDAALMLYLQRSGLVPEARIRVTEVARANATITVALLDREDHQVTVSLPTAGLIMVRHDP